MRQGAYFLLAADPAPVQENDLQGVLAVAHLGVPLILVVGGRRMQPADQGGARPAPLGLAQQEALSGVVLRAVLPRIRLTGVLHGLVPQRWPLDVGPVDRLDELVHVVGDRDRARVVDDPVQGGRAQEHVLLAVDRLGARLQRRVGG